MHGREGEIGRTSMEKKVVSVCEPSEIDEMEEQNERFDLSESGVDFMLERFD